MQDKRSSVMWAISLLLLAAMVSIVSIQAQEVTAAINGAVTDPSGAAIAGAQVTVTDMDRGTRFTATTSIGGNYSLPRLPVGRYEVRVENGGFQTAIKKDVTLVLNQVAELNFQLQIGNVGQTVEVSSAAPLLQTEQTQVNTVMETNAILAIPLQSRNYQQLALLTPAPSLPARPRSTAARPRLTPAGRTLTATASRPTTTCSTAWTITNSSTIMSLFRPTWMPSTNST